MNPGLTTASLTSSYTTRITVRTHELYADEPIALQGNDTAPSPMELLCGALASCTAITLKMYFGLKNIQTDQITVVVAMEDDANGQKKFIRSVEVLSSELNDTLKAKILDIANKCPVHRMFEQHTIITSILE
ncbi:MAG: OsmC family protein [Candidatus Kapabacteria bacterium]|nr:OsmC family protein [Candidatus Kapabacteria bacterium]